jgi:polyisoprenoid-binding protein YceI
MKAIVLATALLLSAPAWAATLAPIPIAPPGSALTYTVFALGLLPIKAAFLDFSGTVSADPAAPMACAVHIGVRIASMALAGPSRALALGPTMLDAQRFPAMQFEGTCNGTALAGALTLHGVTHNLVMQWQRHGRRISAHGTVQRRDYGVDGLSGLVGQRIRFDLETTLPPSFATPG